MTDGGGLFMTIFSLITSLAMVAFAADGSGRDRFAEYGGLAARSATMPRRKSGSPYGVSLED